MNCLPLQNLLLPFDEKEFKYAGIFKSLEGLLYIYCSIIDHLIICVLQAEPHPEKTCLQGFRPGQTQTRLCSYRRWLNALCSGYAESRFSHDAAQNVFMC